MMKLLNLLQKMISWKVMGVVFFAWFIFPGYALALSDTYQDVVASIVDQKVEEGKVNLYFFRGDGCPHCAEEEKWLKQVEENYQNSLNVYEFEIWNHEENAKLLDDVKTEFKSSSKGVPFTVVGKSYFVGFSEATASSIENKIKEYVGMGRKEDNITLPFLGSVNMKQVSIPLVAVVLGFIDGFNPCAMWILLFLINMLLGLNNKKKSWGLGFTFLLVSALVYFFSMLGMNLVLGVSAIGYLKIAIGIFILGAGVWNLRKYIKTRKVEAGCSVVDNKKRKKLIVKMRKILDSKSFIMAFVGIVLLAISVNLIELACSLGFPMIFTEILSLNDVTGVMRIVYLLVYIFFYMIDDMVVFSLSMITLQATGITNKYQKLCTLVSAMIMIAMGLLLLFKPEWLMLNF